MTNRTAEPALNPALKVASATPGRIRLRVPSSHRDPENLHRLQQHLAGRPDVETVETNYRTGSVLITTTNPDLEPANCDSDEIERDVGILDDLDEIGNVLSFGMGGSEVNGIAIQLGGSISRLNARLHAATGENFHLGTLVPGSMAVVGAWQTVRTGLGLDLIPGPLMLWLAWDLYQAFGAAPTPTLVAEVDRAV